MGQDILIFVIIKLHNIMGNACTTGDQQRKSPKPTFPNIPTQQNQQNPDPRPDQQLKQDFANSKINQAENIDTYKQVTDILDVVNDPNINSEKLKDQISEGSRKLGGGSGISNFNSNKNSQIQQKYNVRIYEVKTQSNHTNNQSHLSKMVEPSDNNLNNTGSIIKNKIQQESQNRIKAEKLEDEKFFRQQAQLFSFNQKKYTQSSIQPNLILNPSSISNPNSKLLPRSHLNSEPQSQLQPLVLPNPYAQSHVKPQPNALSIPKPQTTIIPNYVNNTKINIITESIADSKYRTNLNKEDNFLISMKKSKETSDLRSIDFVPMDSMICYGPSHGGQYHFNVNINV